MSANDLKPFKQGTLVWIQNAETGKWDDAAKILCQIRKRTYKIELDNGRITHRNRRKLRKRQITPTGSYSGQEAISQLWRKMDNSGGHPQNVESGGNPQNVESGGKPQKGNLIFKPRRSERIRKKTHEQ